MKTLVNIKNFDQMYEVISSIDKFIKCTKSVARILNSIKLTIKSGDLIEVTATDCERFFQGFFEVEYPLGFKHEMSAIVEFASFKKYIKKLAVGKKVDILFDCGEDESAALFMAFQLIFSNEKSSMTLQASSISEDEFPNSKHTSIADVKRISDFKIENTKDISKLFKMLQISTSDDRVKPSYCGVTIFNIPEKVNNIEKESDKVGLFGTDSKRMSYIATNYTMDGFSHTIPNEVIDFVLASDYHLYKSLNFSLYGTITEQAAKKSDIHSIEFKANRENYNIHYGRLMIGQGEIELTWDYVGFGPNPLQVIDLTKTPKVEMSVYDNDFKKYIDELTGDKKDDIIKLHFETGNNNISFKNREINHIVKLENYIKNDENTIIDVNYNKAYLLDALKSVMNTQYGEMKWYSSMSPMYYKSIARVDCDDFDLIHLLMPVRPSFVS